MGGARRTPKLETMELIYLTDGQNLQDGELRALCLRLPEVLVEVRNLEQAKGMDLLNSIPFREDFLNFDLVLRSEIIGAMQAGLLSRVRNRLGAEARLLRRQDHESGLQVAREIRWQGRGHGTLSVHVVGPGFDDVPSLLKGTQIVFVDAIAEDPLLSWFWENFKKAASS